MVPSAFLIWPVSGNTYRMPVSQIPFFRISRQDGATTSPCVSDKIYDGASCTVQALF